MSTPRYADKLLTLRDLQSAAKKYGATLDDQSVTGGGRKLRQFTVDAPTGKVWACDGIHGIFLTWYDGEDDGHWRDEVIRDALERMSRGLDDCEDPDCDVCGEP